MCVCVCVWERREKEKFREVDMLWLLGCLLARLLQLHMRMRIRTSHTLNWLYGIARFLRSCPNVKNPAGGGAVVWEPTGISVCFYWPHEN